MRSAQTRNFRHIGRRSIPLDTPTDAKLFAKGFSMSQLVLATLFGASMMAGLPPAHAAEPLPPVVRQCQTEVQAACAGENDKQCLDTGYRACALLHGDPANADRLGGRNLRAQIFAIETPPPASSLARENEESSSIFITNTD